MRKEGLHPAFLIGSLAAMVLALGLALAVHQPPEPKPITAPAREFSAGRAWLLLQRLVAEERPHVSGTEDNARVRARIVHELTAIGYGVETQPAFVCRVAWAECGHVVNIMARLPGQSARQAVLLTAHYDSVGAGPGTADDMAGVAVILEVARMLRVEAPLRNPVIFLLSDGEEPALLGAEAFVAAHPWAREVGVVVNLEARGTRGESLLFETSPHNRWLISAYVASAPRPVASSVFFEMYKFLPANTDLTVHKEAGKPGVNFAFSEAVAHYHTPLDNLEHLDRGSLQHQGDNVLAMTRALAGLDLANPPRGDSVYVDLLPGLVIQWPAEATILMALASFLLWLGLAGVLIGRHHVRGREVLWGLVAVMLGLIGAMLLGFSVTAVTRLATGTSDPWHAYPLPSLVGIGAGALLALASHAMLLGRRAGFWGLAHGVWLWWALWSVLSAWWLPGFSVVFLIPAVVAIILLAVASVTRLRVLPWTLGLASVGGAFSASFIWLPFAWRMFGLEAGFDEYLGASAGFIVGLGISGLVPVFALQRVDRIRRGVVASAALIMIAAILVATRVPSYSALRPQRLNIMHIEDRASGEAYWMLDSPWVANNAGLKVPTPLVEAAAFGSDLVDVLPWSDRPYLVARATPTAVPAPQAEVLADNRSGTERVVTLRLRSPRGAIRLALYVPQSARFERLDVLGTPYTLRPRANRYGFHKFECHGTACDGLRVALHLKSTGPLEVFVVDESQGLPPEGAALIRSRPESAVPSAQGDVTVIGNRVRFGAK